MPKSRIRKKADFTPPPAKQATAIKLTNRSWVAPVMLALFLIGLAWIVVFYVTEGDLPVDALGNWNIVVGFGFIAEAASPCRRSGSDVPPRSMTPTPPPRGGRSLVPVSARPPSAQALP